MKLTPETAEAFMLFKQLARVVQANLVYPEGSERRTASARLFLDSLARWSRPFRVSLIGNQVVVERDTMPEMGGVEKLLVRTLQKARWESLRIEKDISIEGLFELVRSAVTMVMPPIEGKGFSAGLLTLESVRAGEMPITNAAIGYLSLLSGARDTIIRLGGGDPDGIDDARRVVAGLAAHLAGGIDVFSPIRSLKHYDDYTYTHALNVSLIAMAIGKKLGLDDDLLEQMSLGALCHDIGKERIPKDILNKKSALTPDEREVMNRHPVEGTKMLLALDCALPPLVPVVAYQHHMYNSERNYPPRLPGQRPHPATMLVSVADVFDALRTVRPYREAYATEDAFSILLSEARKGSIYKGFLGPLASMLGVTAAGRRVRLTNGREAVVCNYREDMPLRPTVRYDDGSEVDLSVDGAISIAGVFRPTADPS